MSGIIGDVGEGLAELVIIDGHVAPFKGRHVDRPRNLARSVAVE